MATIRKRGTRWLVGWRDPDGSQRTRSCPDKATADELAREVDRARSLGVRWEPRAPDLAPTLTEAAELYLSHRASRKAANTLINDDRAIAQFMDFLRKKYPRQRRFTVESLTMVELSQFDAALRQRTGSATVNSRVLGVRRLWAWCASRPEFSSRVAPPPESRVLDLPRRSWAPPRAPSWAEMDAAIGVAETPWIRVFLTLLRCTGLRQGQVMRLLWSDFDLEAALLTIRPELGKTRQERAGRTVPISPHLVAFLAGLGVREGWVVAPHRTVRMASCRQIDKVWQATAVPAALWEGHPSHAFRYGFTSGLAQLGADREAVEHLVGHEVAGARSHYLDPRWALRLREAVDLVPAVNPALHLATIRARSGS